MHFLRIKILSKRVVQERWLLIASLTLNFFLGVVGGVVRDSSYMGPLQSLSLRQRDGLACLLFNLALERAIRESRLETTGTIFYKSTQILAYADDIDIIGLRHSYVAEAYQGIEQAAENLSLQINEVKTKLMVATSAGLPIKNQNLRRCDVQIDERTFEVVSQFTYLESKVSNDNSMEAELRTRMLAANRSFYSLKNQFTSKNLSRRTNIVPIQFWYSHTPLRHGHCPNLTKPSQPRSRRRCSEGYLAPYVWKDNG